jgi:hypothetical protein
MPALGQGQEPGQPGDEAVGRGGLVAVMERPTESSREDEAGPINRFLAKDTLQPEQVARLNKAFTLALRSLGVGRNDPIVDSVAKKIIEVATAGTSDPREIADTAIKRLGVRPGKHARRGPSK